MSHNSNTAQAEREQQFVKDKAEDLAQGVRKVRDEGLSAVNPGVPTTEGAVRGLDKAERAVDSAQNSYRGQQAGGKGQEVLQDIKRVIADEKAMVRKNDGDLLQHIISNSCTLLHDLSSDTGMKGIFSNWQNLSASLLNTSNMSELLGTGNEIFKSLKDTEEFLHLASEMLNMVKLLIAEGQERLTDNRSANLSELQTAKRQTKDEIVEDLTELLRTLANNEMWVSLTQRAKNRSRQVKGHAEQTKDAAVGTLAKVLDSQATTQLINDVRTFLQRLVGEQMDVNAFFNALAQVLLEFSENQDLADSFYDMQDELAEVAKNPSSMDDPAVRKRLEDVSERAQCAIDKVIDSPAFVKMRAETQHLVEAVMNDPTNARLINDTRKLWHDIKSDQPGQIFDPTLLVGVRQMIIPMFLDHLSNVPVPSIQDSGDLLGKYDYSLNNIKLDVPQMLPENIHLRFDHEMDANLMNLSATNQKTFIFLEARDIQVHLHNVEWTFHRHRLPRFSDSGHADIRTEGRGVILRLKMELRNDTPNNHLVEVHAAQVIIDRFSVAFSDSKHNKMYKMMTNLFATRIKREVEKAMENKMKDFGNLLNAQVITLLNDAKTKSHENRGLMSAKIEQAKQTVAELRDQAHDAKEHTKARAGELKEQAKTSLSGTSEQGKGLLRDEVQRRTGEDPEQMIDEAKGEIKARSRGAITLAAERATAIVDEQQQKIEQQRLEKQFDKHANIHDPAATELRDMRPVADLAKRDAPTADLAKHELPSSDLAKHQAPPQQQKPETPAEREERELAELQEVKRKQQAGSSDVPLGFTGMGGTTSADITYALHSQIPSFDPSSPKVEHKDPATPAK